MQKRSRTILGFIAIGMALLLMPVSRGHATSVIEVSMNEMLEQSQFVFEGRVIAVEPREGSQKRIHTYITLEILDVIKGEFPGNIITLRFLGGTVGDVTLAVSDMQMPRQGEQGIYFVESLERTQVHPLYGWSQGHFIVTRDVSGVEKVMTNRGLPVTGVKGETPDRKTVTGMEQVMSRGVSRDLIVGQDGEKNSAMTVVEFKRILHERMGKGR